MLFRASYLVSSSHETFVEEKHCFFWGGQGHTHWLNLTYVIAWPFTTPSIHFETEQSAGFGGGGDLRNSLSYTPCTLYFFLEQGVSSTV